MFQKSTSIKIFLLNFAILFSFFNSALAVQERPSFIRPDLEKKCLLSVDTVYTGIVNKEIRSRCIELTLMAGYILNEKWSVYGFVPLSYEHTFYPEEVPKGKQKTETLLLARSILFLPRYTFRLRSSRLHCSLGFQLPTCRRIYGNMTYDTKEHNLFSLQPGVAIEKVCDPVISIVEVSYSQPLWREKDRKNLSDLMYGQISAGLHFIINERFSYFTSLAVLVRKEQENYLCEFGVSYLLKMCNELRIYLLNNYDGILWNTSIGLLLVFGR